MKLPRRQFLHLAAGAAALPALSRVASAQAYPTRPVRLLVGWPAGGAVDVVGRLTGQLLSERLGQQFVIENRPGAGGNLAVEAALKAAPDGYTLLMIGSNNAWNVTLYDNLSFDFLRDIAPVASIVRTVGVLVVHPSVSVKSVPDLIAYAKANPGKIKISSGGVGSAQHVYGELFKMMAGVDMLHVPYRGGAPALTDMTSSVGGARGCHGYGFRAVNSPLAVLASTAARRGLLGQKAPPEAGLEVSPSTGNIDPCGSSDL
jgi:tripartite-type tricarboxylate transporter receptor subunit TctC